MSFRDNFARVVAPSVLAIGLAGCAGIPAERVLPDSVVRGTLSAREAAARAAAHATQCLIGTRSRELCEADRRAAEPRQLSR